LLNETLSNKRAKCGLGFTKQSGKPSIKKGATLVDDSLCWFIREIRVIRGFFFSLAYAAIPFDGIAQMFIESAFWRSFS
jgi:hypothetical protein